MTPVQKNLDHEDHVYTYSGERIAALCDLHRITRSALAEQMGVSQGFISQLVNGTTQLPADFVAKLCAQFSLPPRFFVRQWLPGQHAAVTFRKRSSTSARDDRRIKILFSEASRLWYTAAETIDFPRPDLPLAEEHNWDAESCAELIRQEEGLSAYAPVNNVIRLFEKRKIAVTTGLDPTNAGSRDHVGISRPSRDNSRPVIGIVGTPPGGVLRLTVAHEAGHLIFDRDREFPISGPRSMEERRAYRFAGALLIPEIIMRNEVTETLPLRGYLSLKARFGMNASAIIQRAHDLGIITQERLRTLFIQMSSQGWRENEPVEIPEEQPLLFKQAIGHCWPELTVTSASEATGVPASLISDWLGTVNEKKEDLKASSGENVVQLSSWKARRQNL